MTETKRVAAMSAKTALQPPPSTMVHDMPSATRQSSLNLLTSNLGTDLFSMLGMTASATGSAVSESTQELDVPSPESYVVCAVLDDGAKTRVRLGTARFYTASQTYHLSDGSLQILESSLDKESGLYHTSTGVYALMSEEEYGMVYGKQLGGAAAKKRCLSDGRQPHRTIGHRPSRCGEPPARAAAAGGVGRTAADAARAQHRVWHALRHAPSWWLPTLRETKQDSTSSCARAGRLH